MSIPNRADTTANPAPLGLMGFGMTTILLNLHNAGMYPLDTMVLGMGIFMGGIAQVIAGTMEWKKGNTFAATAFSAYGFFWLTLVAILLLPKMGTGFAGPNKMTAMPAFLIVWGIFSAVMFLATLKFNRGLQITFALVVALFFLLALGDITGSETITRIAGWEGVACGASAAYVGLAQVINEVHGRTVWPLGPVTA